MLVQLTGGQSTKEDLAVLHVKLVNPDHQLPFSFLMAELIKGLLTQRRTKKREEWHKLEASILAKKSFLDNIPHLACVSNIISDWLTSLFSLPASASTGPYRANLPPNANSASCTRGDHTGMEIGVIGRTQQHLITSFFIARPRPPTPANQTMGLHADSAAARRPSILSSLQNQPAQAATAALLSASQPHREQRAAHNPVNRPSGEAPSSTAPDVPTQTDHGRQCDRGLVSCLTHRPFGCRSVCCSGCDPAVDSRLHVCLQKRLVPESNFRQALGSPPDPDPSDHVPPAAATDVHVHQHDACYCPNHQPCD